MIFVSLPLHPIYMIPFNAYSNGVLILFFPHDEKCSEYSFFLTQDKAEALMAVEKFANTFNNNELYARIIGTPHITFLVGL